MLGNAFTLAALTSAGFFMVYKKLPLRAKLLIIKYNLVSDIGALLATYVIFGGTVTALIAASLVSIVVSVMLHIAAHPEDFLFLSDTIATVKLYIQEGKKYITSLNQNHVAKVQ